MIIWCYKNMNNYKLMMISIARHHGRKFSYVIVSIPHDSLIKSSLFISILPMRKLRFRHRHGDNVKGKEGPAVWIQEATALFPPNLESSETLYDSIAF